MGNTFTVEVWKLNDWSDAEYAFYVTWQGESLIRALIALFKAKRMGYGCTRLNWR